MALSCPYCASAKLHRSRRYGVDFVVSVLFGKYPYRCSSCNRRFRAKSRRRSSHEPEPPVETVASRERPRGRTGKPPVRKNRRAVLRELLLYTAAFAGFLAFLRWVTQDRPSQPPQP